MSTARANLETVISADMSQYSATMRKAGMVAQATAGKIGKSMANAAANLAKAGVAAAGLATVIGGAALVRGIKNAADLGGKLADLSARTSIAAGDLAVLGRAFEDNGVSADKIGATINKLQKAIYDAAHGSKKAAEPFQALGLSIADLAKLEPAKQFAAVQRAIAGVEGTAARTAIAMQIFGKSGGELLTLFSDSGAIGKARDFLGTQAEILNRRAATFDEISDILARAGAKLQGFTVGVLDAIADKLLPALQHFDQMDLAAMGQQFGGWIEKAAGWTFQMADNAYQFGQWLIKGIETAALVLKMNFSADYWSAQGMLIAAAFGDGVNVLKAGIEAANAMVLATWREMPNVVWNAFKFLSDGNFWGSVKDSLVNAAVSFAMTLSDHLQKVFSMLKNMDFAGLKDFATNLADQAKKGTSKAFSFSVGDDLGKSWDRIKKAGEDAFKNSNPIFDTSGLKKGAAQNLAPFAKDWKEIWERPILTLPQTLKAVMGKISPPSPTPAAAGGNGFAAKRDSASAAGFRGLAGLYGMQADKAAGLMPGQNNIFAKDRSRLGIIDGTHTGGLGEKRRLKTSWEDKSAKRSISIQEKQVNHLASIDTKIERSLTAS